MDGALESSPSSSSASTPTRSAKFFEDTPLLVSVLQEFEQTPLTFFRVRSTPTADLVFGSVTTKDVARSLNEKLPDNCHLTFDPERITLLKSSESSVNQGEGKATEEELKKLTTLGESVARVIWAQGQPPRTIKVLIKVPERDFEKEKIEL